MKRTILLSILLIIFNQHQVFADRLNKEIRQEIKNIDPNINIGIKIKNLATKQVIYRQNIDRHYMFASSLKLMVLSALQQYFGNEHHFVSKILQEGNNYYLDINSPDFSTNDLDSLLKTLKDEGSGIIGNFYIVNSTFSLPPTIDSRMISDTKYCYGALVTKVHIDKNCVKLQIRPNKKIKEAIYIEQKESLPPYEIINKAITIGKDQQDKINANIQGDNLIISGTLNQGRKDLFIVAVADNNLYHIKLILQKLLTKHNIQITGQILYGVKPLEYKEVAMVDKSFNQIASFALKNSDNFVIDYLFAEFGNIYAIDDWAKVGNLLKQYILEKFNVDLANSVIVDGSGLSRYNLLTVEQFDEFLNNLYYSQQFQKIKYMMAYPTEDSTLNGRFQGINIFAKTGTMSGISSLVGYVYDKNNVPYSFVIVSNNYLGSKDKYAELEETIIRLIIKQRKTTSKKVVNNTKNTQ